MLTKEACFKALRYITDLYEELYITRLKESGNHIDDTKEYWILEELINEHFELLEKYQNLQDENARLSFDKIVNNIEDMNYKLLLENPPLQLEDIHVGMWLWDNVDKMYTQVVGYYTETCLVCSLGLKREYEPNRFYKMEVV